MISDLSRAFSGEFIQSSIRLAANNSTAGLWWLRIYDITASLPSSLVRLVPSDLAAHMFHIVHTNN